MDSAIVNLDLHYNNALCLEILLIDCGKHVTVGDEVVCASNGKTYDNQYVRLLYCQLFYSRFNTLHIITYKYAVG